MKEEEEEEEEGSTNSACEVTVRAISRRQATAACDTFL
jgi:hypothetical protein